MPSFNVDIEFEVYCGSCGAGLCSQSETQDPGIRTLAKVTVMPCERCLRNSRGEGVDEGYDKGFADGKEEGYDEGFNAASE